MIHSHPMFWAMFQAHELAGQRQPGAVSQTQPASGGATSALYDAGYFFAFAAIDGSQDLHRERWPARRLEHSDLCRDLRQFLGRVNLYPPPLLPTTAREPTSLRGVP